MANPVSIVQPIIDLALKIKEAVETFRHNREDCRKIGELVATVRAVAESLRKSMEEEEDGGVGALVGGALKALKQALERAWDFVVACQRKNAVLRALEADAVAEKLRRVCLDVSLNLSAVVLANGAYNTSKLADINGIVAALRADVAYNTWMLAKIMEIVAALPDAHLHLRQQVARLLQIFSYSTDDDASYYQNESIRETKKTDDHASYYQK
ncbi:unnamed protein product [Miscanthus lutarioriparius]|uniref:Mixed lineage kinase domain-containing protein n=1 Tax=Miscanthus lutarioriparius TaxID=422564 RepID=A0A811S9K6_9POAL|nr:unnamed protein product [Miscanthus lutarioriparius]